MADDAWQFAAFRLGLVSSIHAGSWRAGMVAQTHRFIPGHLFSYALAAVYGGHLGGQPNHYAEALQAVLSSVRFAPALLSDGQQLLYPQQHRNVIEQLYLRGNNHVTLQLDSCAAQDKALFEVEYISAKAIGGARTELLGGCWFRRDGLDGLPWQHWFGQFILGGEGKIGYGRCSLINWDKKAESFHDIGKIIPGGLKLAAGDRLPGPALSGVGQAPQQPWLGRLYDEKQGFGRRLSAAAWVCMDGVCENEAVFLPHAEEVGLGCWTVVA